MADNCSTSNGGTKGLQAHLSADNSQHRDRVVPSSANAGTGNAFRLPQNSFIAHGEMSFEDFVESNGFAAPRQAVGPSVNQSGPPTANGTFSRAQEQIGQSHLKIPFEQAWKMYMAATSYAAQHGPNPPVAAVAGYPTQTRLTLRPGQPGVPMRASAGQTTVPMRPAPGPFHGHMPQVLYAPAYSGVPAAPIMYQNGVATMVPRAPHTAINAAHNANAVMEQSKRWTSEQWEAAYVGAQARYNDNTEFMAAEDTWMAEQLKLEKRLKTRAERLDNLGGEYDYEADAATTSTNDRLEARAAVHPPEPTRSPETVVAYNAPQEAEKVEEKLTEAGRSELAQVAADIVGTMSTGTMSPGTTSKFQGSNFMRLMRGVANNEIIVKGDNFVERETKRPVANIVYEGTDHKLKATVADAEEETDTL